MSPALAQACAEFEEKLREVQDLVDRVAHRRAEVRALCGCELDPADVDYARLFAAVRR